MLELINITKVYGMGENSVHALKGVSLKFRKSEFVSVLGPSGCGKTTMLNIVGGLDRYTSGDLLINGKSTTQFKPYDWDAYRNNCVGFVFQNYNLIPHQTVQGNVELALTLSGVSKQERKRMAETALDKVGLSDQKHKLPSQLSGGQMQRVAIARALVNNPQIILADEPTGALDSATSIQVLDLLKEIAEDRLVIMVTHNKELAQKYSTRIISLLDGNVESDTNPLSNEEQWAIYNDNQARIKSETEGLTDKAAQKKRKMQLKKTSMSFLTALKLSTRNLLTKKGRSMLVSFAGSIGIIGIALVLAISNGFKIYINKIETETLANFPVSISRVGIDLTSLSSTEALEEFERVEQYPEGGTSLGFYEAKSILDIIGKPNNITKEYIDYVDEIKNMTSNSSAYRGLSLALDVQKSYAIRMPLISTYDYTNEVKFIRSSWSSSSMSSIFGSSSSYFTEMLDNPEFVLEQYDVIHGDYPENHNEIALVVDSSNRISKSLAKNLGFNDNLDEMDFDAILNKTYKIILNDLYYSIDETTGEVTALETKSQNTLKDIYENKQDGDGIIELKISGIMRQKEDAIMVLYDTGLVYLPSLTAKYLESCETAQIATLQQTALSGTDAGSWQVYKALYSETEIMETFVDAINFYESMKYALEPLESMPEELKRQTIKAMLQADDVYGELDEETLDDFVTMLLHLKTAVEDFYDENKTSFGLSLCYFSEMLSSGFIPISTVRESVMQKIGVGGLPTSLFIYPRSFETKSEILAYLDAWNNTNPDNKITYTDPAAMLSSTMGQMIDIISYVLAAFAGVSLVVSSIMIGIITYVSVIERTKEIGVLRSIGARKKDIARVFNAETIIIGFVAGLMGIIIAYLLCVPINAIILALAGNSIVGNLAVLNPIHALILVGLSMVLTLISGLLPSSFASRRDPVAALRSE